jgi:hypothetical protein
LHKGLIQASPPCRVNPQVELRILNEESKRAGGGLKTRT